MNNKIGIIIKTFFLTTIFSSLLYCGTYDDNYRVLNKGESNSTNVEFFMNGDFDKIIRFNPLVFDGNELDEESMDDFNSTLNRIKEYVDQNETVLITLIGHTRATTDNKNEIINDSDTYANKILNLFRFSLDQNESEHLSRDYAKSIQEEMVKNGIDKKDIIVEYRAGKDELFSGSCSSTAKKSNRVMVTLYVLFPTDAEKKESFLESLKIDTSDVVEDNATSEVDSTLETNSSI